MTGRTRPLTIMVRCPDCGVRKLGVDDIGFTHDRGTVTGWYWHCESCRQLRSAAAAPAVLGLLHGVGVHQGFLSQPPSYRPAGSTTGPWSACASSSTTLDCCTGWRGPRPSSPPRSGRRPRPDDVAGGVHVGDRAPSLPDRGIDGPVVDHGVGRVVDGGCGAAARPAPAGRHDEAGEHRRADAVDDQGERVLPPCAHR